MCSKFLNVIKLDSHKFQGSRDIVKFLKPRNILFNTLHISKVFSVEYSIIIWIEIVRRISKFLKSFTDSLDLYQMIRKFITEYELLKAIIDEYFCYREVCVDEGQQLSLAHGCQFYEVSAAESPAGAALAFQALLREARSVQLLRALPIRRKLGVHSVSRVLGTIFGKNTTKDRKKRPSLSIWRLLCTLLLGGRDEPCRRTDIVVLSSNVYSNRWSERWKGCETSLQIREESHFDLLCLSKKGNNSFVILA